MKTKTHTYRVSVNSRRRNSRIVEDGKKRIKTKTMTEIWHVIVFVACTYVTINSTVFERLCVDSRKRIETPVDVLCGRESIDALVWTGLK